MNGRLVLVSVSPGRPRHPRVDRLRVLGDEFRCPEPRRRRIRSRVREEGNFGSVPETIHEKTYHLLCLLVANHPFVDGNKRTALNTGSVFYLLNSYRFAYDDEIRTVLKRFGTDEATVDETWVLEYLRTHTKEVDLDEVVAEWRDDLVRQGLAQLSDESSDPND
ncbi:MAG: type II toxin-antitoxin system death-on-curing family toxin [Halobacteriaceae archaeon]